MASQPKLKMAIFESKYTQRDVAEMLGFSDSWLSQIIHGRLKLSSEHKKLLCAVLGKTEKELFD